MKFKKLIFPMLSIATFLTIGAVNANNIQAAKATFVDKSVVTENFDKKQLDADTWASNDTNLNVDHYSLRIDPENYEWTGHLLLQSVRMSDDYIMEMTVSAQDTGGWFGISFGVKEKGGLFSDASFALIIQPVYAGPDVNNGIPCNWSSGYLAPDYTSPIYAPIFKESGVKYKVRFYVDIIDTYSSTVCYDVFTVDDVPLYTHTDSDIIYADRNLSGYVGFNNSGINVEITHFALRNQSDNSLLYEDDFTTSSVQTATGGEGVWAAQRFSDTDIACGPIGDLKLNGNGSSLTALNKFVKPEYDTVHNLYYANVEVGYSSMTSNAIAGFEVGKSDVTSTGDIFGLKKDSFGYSLVHVSQSGEIVDSVSCSTHAPGLKPTLYIEVRLNKSVKIYTSQISLTGTIDSTEGFMGFKCISTDANACSGPVIDNFNINKMLDKGDKTADASINFNGTQTKKAGYFEYEDFYVNKKEWYVTSTGDMFLSNYDDSIDPNNPDGKLYYSHSAFTTIFGSRNKYSNYVIKFKLQILTEVEDLEERAGFALEYGMDNFTTYYDNNQSVGLYNTSATNPKQSIAILNHCKTPDTKVDTAVFPDPNDGNKFLQLFAKRNGEFPIFDVMYIVKDGLVSMHFKFEDEPESVLLTPRIVAKAERGTDGYACIVGTGGIDFSIDDYSITNLDYVTNDLDYVPYDGGEYQLTTRKDFTVAKDTTGLVLSGASLKNNSLRIPSNAKVETEGKVSDGLFRFKLKGLEDTVKFNFGNASISLVNQGSTKKIVAKDTRGTQTIDLGADFSFVNSTFEITKNRSTFKIKYVSGDTPLSAILDVENSISLSTGDDYYKFNIESDGITDLSSFTFVNFDSHQKIFARNFDPAIDTVVAWTERTSIQELEGGCKGSISVTSLAISIGAISILGLLLLRRKETF